MESFEELLHKAKEFFIAKNFDSCREKLENAISSDKGLDIIYFLIAMTYFAQNKKDEANHYLEVSLSINPKLYPALFYYNIVNHDNKIGYRLAQFYHSKKIELTFDPKLKFEEFIYKFTSNIQDNLFETLSVIISQDSQLLVEKDYFLSDYLNFNIVESFEENISYLNLFCPEFFQIISYFGKFFQKIQKFDSAIIFYNIYLSHNKEDIKILEYLAMCYYKADNLNKTTEICNEYLKYDINNANIYNLLALSLIYSDRYDNVEEYLNQAIDLNPKHKHLYIRNKAIYFLRKGDDVEALQFFKEYLKFQDNDLGIYKNIATIEMKLGRLKHAFETMDCAIKKFPNNIQAYILKGNFLLEKARFSDAKLIFEYTTQIFPDSYFGYYYLAISNRKLGDFRNAIDAIDRAIKISEGVYYESYFEKAKIYTLNREYDKALKILINIFEKHSSVHEIPELISKIYYKFTKYDHALKYANISLSIFPGSSDLLILKSTILMIQKNYADAIEALEQVVILKPKIAFIYKDIGKCYFMLSEKDKALGYFRKAVEISNKEHISLYYISLILYEKKQYFEALDNINKAIILDNNKTNFYELKAKILIDIGDIKEARKICDFGLLCDGEYAELHKLKGITFQIEGDYSSSLNSFRNAINSDYLGLEVTYLSALSFSYMDNNEFAVRLLERVIKEAKDISLDIGCLLIYGYSKIKNFKKANEYCDLLIEKYKNEPKIYEAASKLYILYCENLRALDVLDAGISETNSSDLFFLKGKFLMKMEKFEDARECFIEAMKRDNNHLNSIALKAFIDIANLNFLDTVETLKILSKILSKEKKIFTSDIHKVEQKKSHELGIKISAVDGLIESVIRMKSIFEKVKIFKDQVNLINSTENTGNELVNKKLKYIVREIKEIELEIKFFMTSIKNVIFYFTEEEKDSYFQIFNFQQPVVYNSIIWSCAKELSNILTKCHDIQNMIMILSGKLFGKKEAIDECLSSDDYFVEGKKLLSDDKDYAKQEAFVFRAKSYTNLDTIEETEEMDEDVAEDAGAVEDSEFTVRYFNFDAVGKDDVGGTDKLFSASDALVSESIYRSPILSPQIDDFLHLGKLDSAVASLPSKSDLEDLKCKTTHQSHKILGRAHDKLMYTGSTIQKLLSQMSSIASGGADKDSASSEQETLEHQEEARTHDYSSQILGKSSEDEGAE